MDKEKVKNVIEKIKPALQADGGDVEVKEITDDGIVKVELQGACKGCPMSTMTVKNGIEKTLKEQVPEVKEVKSI